MTLFAPPPEFSLVRCPRTTVRSLSVFTVLVLALTAQNGFAQSLSEPGMDESSYEEEMMNDGEDMGYGESGMDGGYGDDGGYGSDGGYGDDYGGGSGYGGPPSRRSMQRGGDPVAAAQQQAGVALASILGRIDLKPFLDPAPDAPVAQAGPVLLGEAEEAYRNGNYPLGLQLFFGHMAAEYDDALVNVQAVKYSPLLRRPVWAIRWGVSYAVRGEGDSPNPISDSGPARLAANGGRGANMGRGAMDEGYGQEMGYDEGMDMREPEMEMGMEDDPSMYDMGMQGDGGYGDPRSRRAASKPAPLERRSMLDEDAAAALDKNLGLVATIVAEEFQKRYLRGDYGVALTNVSAPVDPDAPESTGTLTPALNELLSSASDALPMWKPGIMFVGQGESVDNAKIAAKQGLDVLLHFDILLKQPRGGETQNISRCRLIHAVSGKTLGTSKAFDSNEAAQILRAGRSSTRDYVAERLDVFFGIIDRQVKAVPLPGLSPEVAKRRVGALLAGGGRSLRTLAEVRLYQFQELLTPEDVEVAFHIVGGEEGLLMLHGSREDKLKTVREWSVNAISRDDP